MPCYFHADDMVPSFVRTLKAVSKRPTKFFEEMAEDVGYKDSIVLLAILMFFPATELVYFNDAQIMLYIFPAVIMGGLFIAWLWAQYVSWSLRVFHHHHVEKTGVFRVIAYANALNVLHLTIFLSPIVFIWQIYLMYRGFVSHLGINAEVAGWLIAIPFICISFSGLGIVMFMGVTGIIHFE